jgi:hypothetical protein
MIQGAASELHTHATAKAKAETTNEHRIYRETNEIYMVQRAVRALQKKKIHDW